MFLKVTLVLTSLGVQVQKCLPLGLRVFPLHRKDWTEVLLHPALESSPRGPGASPRNGTFVHHTSGRRVDYDSPTKIDQHIYMEWNGVSPKHLEHCVRRTHLVTFGVTLVFVESLGRPGTEDSSLRPTDPS